MIVGKLKEVTFYLENCDSITIDGKYIGELDIDNIKNSFSRIAGNAFAFDVCSDSIAIEIHKDANKEYRPFGLESAKTTVFERLTNYSDITSITYTLIDDYGDDYHRPEPPFTHEVSVVYDEEGDFLGAENTLQKSYISDLGHLYIVIDREKDIDDVFELDDINDEDAVDLHMDMCDVGDVYGDPHRYDDEDDEE